MHVSIYSDLSVRQPSLLSPSPAVTALAIFAQNGPQAACRDPKPGEEFDTMKFSSRSGNFKVPNAAS